MQNKRKLTMKTMKNSIGLNGLTYAAIGLFMFFSSCKDNNTIDFSATDNANLQSEANSDAQIEEVDDMSAVALSSDAATLNGREGVSGRSEIVVSDARFTCATVTLTKASDNNVNNIPHGTIVIDFGTGCTGPGGKTRKGKIVIEYKGRRFLPGSSIVTTFDNYFVNGIKVDGTRTLTNSSANESAPVSFTIVESGTLTYPDGTTATRSASRTRTWNRTANPLEDSWTLTGSASGKNRRDKEYVMTITKALVYKRSCAITSQVFMAVEGTKELVTETKKIIIDYGAGACDNTVTITVNGKSKDVTASADGN
jgi:hypothetical protein